MAPNLIEDHFCGGIAFQIDHNAHALARAFIADIGHALDPLVFGGIGDLLDQAGFANLERDRCENNPLAVFTVALYFVARAHDDRAASGRISRFCPRLAQN